MNNTRQNFLKQKYIDGLTSLDEEHELLELNKNTTQENDSWLQFVDYKKVNPPKDLNQSLWAKSAINQRSKKTVFGILLGCLIFIATLFIYNMHPISDSGPQKNKQLLKEAIAFAEKGNSQVISTKEILYQDELVTIYLSND